jgi:hypothetical protein
VATTLVHDQTTTFDHQLNRAYIDTILTATMSIPTPNMIITLPSNTDVLKEASHMTNIKRFFYLWHHTKLLVENYGPYTTYEDTTVFMRATKAQRLNKEPPTEKLAYSLAAAQDCVNSAQPSGPAKDDLLLFTRLWETTMTVLESMLARGSLPQESFGWGIFALSSGYVHPPVSRSASYNTLVAQNIFNSHKYRLQAALLSLPSMDGQRRSEYVVGEKKKLDALVKARRQIHTCGHILLDEFRKGSWGRVRWLHAVEVFERWIRAFGLVPQRVQEQAPEDLQQQVQDEAQEQACEPANGEAQDEVQVEVPEKVQEAQEKVLEKRTEKEPALKTLESEAKPKLSDFKFP